MGNRPIGGFCVIAIASALYLALPQGMENPSAIATAVAAHDIEPDTRVKEAETLASSSIFPIVAPHQLPIADMAEIAADAAIKAGEGDSEPGGQESAQDPENTSEDAMQKHEGIDGRLLTPQTDKINTSAARATRSLADVAFLKHALTTHTDTSHAVSIATSAIGISALRTVAFSHPENTFSGLLDVKADELVHASTTYQHLQGFRTLLRSDGFQRDSWQDLSFDANLGVGGITIEPFLVVIDPGHGGTDPGAKGHNGLLEKDLTLDIARRVRLFLTEVDNIEVQLTRHHDYGLSRQSRVDSIRQSNADMVISLHFNHLPQSDVNLVESFYAGRKNIERSLAKQRRRSDGELHRTNSLGSKVNLDFADGSARLARTLQQQIFTEVSFDNDHVQNAGVKQETLFVLTRSFAPAALIEISCLSYADEAERLESEEYRNRLAAALVDGIRNYHESIQRVPLNSRDSLGA